MADRIPLILNTNANQIQEMPSGDTLDLTGSNINGVGIITASQISSRITGNVDIQAGVITATTIDCNGDLDVDGHINFDNLSIAGVSTFSDTVRVGTGVTIESNGQATFVGIVTFGSGSTTVNNNVVNVGTALTLGHTQGVQFHTQNLHSNGFEVNQVNASGIVTATTFSGSGASLTNLPAAQLSGTAAAINGSNITNLNASNIASGTVPTARLGSGTANNTTFLRGDSTFQTVNTDLVSDSSPQLGGHLDCQTYNIDIGDSSGSGSGRLKFGNGDTQIYHSGSHSYIKHTGTGNFYIDVNTNDTFAVTGEESETIIQGTHNGSVDLFHNGSEKFKTITGGVKVTGVLELHTSSGSNPSINNADGGSGTNLYFNTGGSVRLVVQSDGHTRPASNNTYDLGTSSDRWRNIYTADLQLSNKGKTNDVDNTWGDYTIQEGESDLFLINNRSGKKYKFNLTEVS